MIVQRTLSAKNISHAKAGCVLASVLKFLPLFLLVFPGMAARVLYTNEVACSDPDKCRDICNSEAGCTNIAYVKLVLDLMPRGEKPNILLDDMTFWINNEMATMRLLKCTSQEPEA